MVEMVFNQRTLPELTVEVTPATAMAGEAKVPEAQVPRAPL